jgi:hypothetical protein
VARRRLASIPARSAIVTSDYDLQALAQAERNNAEQGRSQEVAHVTSIKNRIQINVPEAGDAQRFTRQALSSEHHCSPAQVFDG